MASLGEDCYCCGKVLTSDRERKRRRLLSNSNLSDVLGCFTTLVSSSYPSVDTSKLKTGYACRNCVGLLQKYKQVQEQIACNLQSALATLPKVSVPEAASSQELGATPPSTPLYSEAESMHMSRASVPLDLTVQRDQGSPALKVCL